MAGSLTLRAVSSFDVCAGSAHVRAPPLRWRRRRAPTTMDGPVGTRPDLRARQPCPAPSPIRSGAMSLPHLRVRPTSMVICGLWAVAPGVMPLPIWPSRGVLNAYSLLIQGMVVDPCWIYCIHVEARGFREIFFSIWHLHFNVFFTAVLQVFYSVFCKFARPSEFYGATGHEWNATSTTNSKTDLYGVTQQTKEHFAHILFVVIMYAHSMYTYSYETVASICTYLLAEY